MRGGDETPRFGRRRSAAGCGISFVLWRWWWWCCRRDLLLVRSLEGGEDSDDDRNRLRGSLKNGEERLWWSCCCVDDDEDSDGRILHRHDSKLKNAHEYSWPLNEIGFDEVLRIVGGSLEEKQNVGDVEKAFLKKKLKFLLFFRRIKITFCFINVRNYF